MVVVEHKQSNKCVKHKVNERNSDQNVFFFLDEG